MLLAFSGRKTIQMPDWKSQISIFGGVLPSGTAVDVYYSSISFSGTSFSVRTSMNIAGTSLPAGYKQIYNYMAWVEK